jgi:hypothetical protein
MSAMLFLIWSDEGASIRMSKRSGMVVTAAPPTVIGAVPPNANAFGSKRRVHTALCTVTLPLSTGAESIP